MPSSNEPTEAAEKPRYTHAYMMNGYHWDVWGLGSLVWFPSLLLALTVWTLFWKGLALWHSARRGQPWWFVAMLVINTVGILEIVYLFFIAKLRVKQLFEK